MKELIALEDKYSSALRTMDPNSEQFKQLKDEFMTLISKAELGFPGIEGERVKYGGHGTSTKHKYSDLLKEFEAMNLDRLRQVNETPGLTKYSRNIVLPAYGDTVSFKGNTQAGDVISVKGDTTNYKEGQ